MGVAEEYAKVLGEQAQGGRLPTWGGSLGIVMILLNNWFSSACADAGRLPHHG